MHKKLSFKEAFKYPFNRPQGLLNILWVIVPIALWGILLALVFQNVMLRGLTAILVAIPLVCILSFFGYSIRIVKEYIDGKFEKLPEFEFAEQISLGFFIFLKMIPFFIIYLPLIVLLEEKHPGARLLLLPFEIVSVPVLAINLIYKETAAAFFEFSIVKVVVENLGDYLIALIKTILLQIVFLILSVILVGIPAGTYTKNIFLADFYRRHIKGLK